MLACAPSDPADPSWWRVVLDSVLFTVALLQGYEALHAGALATPDGAIAITAATGGGKSTLLSELLGRGLELMADDVLVLESRGAEPPLAHPAAPLMTVPATRISMLGELDPPKTICSLDDERWIAVPVHPQPLPLNAMVVLDRRPGSQTSLEKIEDPLAPLMSSLMDFPRTPERQRTRFELASVLASKTTLWRLTADLDIPPDILSDMLMEERCYDKLLPPCPASSVSAPVPSQPPTGGSAGEPILELDCLYHKWKGPKPPVLDDVSLTLRAGEVTWVGGRNGAGKTTLLRLAAGILLPQRGSVRMGELTPASKRGLYRRRIGFLSAGDRSLQARMRVSQQLDYWGRLAYVPRERRAELVDISLQRFGLEEFAERRVDRMSMGQRQRIRLAMAFLHEPIVLLLDEPRNSLDDDGYELLNQQIEQAAKRGAAVLWCSPRGEDRVLACDAGYTLEDGRLERVQ